MRHVRHGTAAAVCLLLACCGAARGRMAEAETVELKFVAGGPAGAVYTPSKLLDQGKRFHFGEAFGKIRAGGHDILVAGRYVGDGYLLGVDCDGDEKIGSGEWVRLNLLTYTASFGLMLPSGSGKKPYALRFTGVAIGVRANQVINVTGRYMIDGCMAGKFQGQDVWLFDDNMDGVYAQDATDAILIGDSPGAMPLRRYHQVGRHHYLLNVRSDGTEVVFQRLEDPELGGVDLPIRASLVRCLMLQDAANGRCYDIRQSGIAGIPTGKYALAYAVLGAGDRIVVAGPGAKSHTYEIKPDVVNILRFGPPCTLTFEAYFHARDQQIRVRTNVVPYGEGGERYYMQWAGYHPLGESPNVMFVAGGRVLTSSHMVYNSEDVLQELGEWVPAGFTKDTGRIVMNLDLPVLGKATGVRELGDILDGKRAETPDAKTPAVATRPLPEGIQLGSKPPPRPEPRPEPPRTEPRAVTPPPPPEPPPEPPRPASTRPASVDPEYEAALMLDIAKAFLDQGRKELAVAKLKEVIKQHPRTGAAKKADGILIDIEVRDGLK